MSEITKPAEAPAVEAVEQESKPIEEPKPAEDAVAQPTEETVAEPVKEEVKPVEEGILGYKGPGLLKSFMFQKKFFYFGTEPVEHNTLSSYLRGEKAQESAISNAAWASHTGEGLLFFTKKHADKASPAGIFNLSQVTDLAEDGTVEFTFVSGGHKHTFQASTLSERDNWVSVLKTKIEEAKTLAPTVTESEKYKETHSTLSKPAVVAAAVLPKKSVEKAEAKEEKKEEKAEAKEEKKEEKAEAKEEKKEEKAEIKEEKKEEKAARKSRSASRKRNSIFGSFLKKDEKSEPKEEASNVPLTTEEQTPVIAEQVIEPVPETTEATPDEPIVAETKPTTTKRNSIFGNLKSTFSGSKVPKAETEAPAVPAKEAITEPITESAPIIPTVEAQESLATSLASPATVPTEITEIAETNGEPKTESPAVKSDKRKSSLPWLSKKEKPATSDDEVTEKPKSPFAKLRATVKGKKAEKAAEKPAETTEESAEPTTVEPVEDKPESIIASTPQVAASA